MGRIESTENCVQIILPGDPEFGATLSQIPPDWKHQADAKGCFGFVPDAALGGILRPANSAEVKDYVLGGEYEQHLQNLHGEFYTSPDGSEWYEEDFDGVEEFYVDW
ncbi:MAG: hypothetical protein JGK17_31065 [Microcoleus sp. PH2017_10_PVI_O_A]|uniref:hypothetical protein n=1 Tax=unclassified Microcoleus TaxID=2642155 RepID=UPI001D8CCBFC|nr:MULTISPECIES: hypothetical protein [unclassified Microcoleus]MCC3409901.1 hypothetical protein [Microcoleus sp. PH2017_10_PVI_O_A]MCC3464075.1 hypothetical protein [Microcoleus sp. PH2017_11_PCY_U_A]MCC3482428.1 hypothetical protein [Microcoleus sp. PH2017_12_PCY_D_A]MCC3531012.1 hypothetical protein [Microcoleus sp. PH2017_21_RUC_O_A]MCC3539744.1 hypothetical protein [Microcoleus sp. PH2017_22_RUC_O_B]